jgi:superfamily I DNA/RNA helicase
MLRLRKLGGAHQRAYDESCRIIASLEIGGGENHKLTKHGESRIPHCVKYDISNDAHRLVTVQTDNFIYLLFVGTHDDTEHWLNRNRGLTISCNPETKRVTVTHITQDQPRTQPIVNFAKLTEENMPYFQRMAFNPSELVTERLLLRTLNKIDDNTSEEELEEIFESLHEFDPEIASLIMDLIFEVREGNISGARARLEQFYQRAVAVQEDAALEAEAVLDSVNSDNLAVLTGLTEDQLKDLYSPEKFQEWMLFLHPDQKRIAEADYDQAAVLTGVSGSGKTCVLVHRARYLARKYPGERIGVLTLNRSLSRLISNLVSALCNESERENIIVMAFYDYFANLVRKFGPDKELQQLAELAKSHEQEPYIRRAIEQVDPTTYAREFDPRSGETLDDTWELFLEQPKVRSLMSDYQDHLWKHDEWVDPGRYLREEFSLVRSAVPTSQRVKDYLELIRSGRAIPLPESIRRDILDLLLLYEETMISGGILDELGLTLALLPHLMDLGKLQKEDRFRCLLIDEFQDFSTRDLALLRRISQSSKEEEEELIEKTFIEKTLIDKTLIDKTLIDKTLIDKTLIQNRLFIAGDSVQRVLVKDLRLGAVGLDIISARWERMTKNYRNSHEILKTAAILANQYSARAKGLGEDIEFLDPDLAVRQTCRPKAVACPPGREIETAWRFANDALNISSASPWSVCIVTACTETISVEEILSAKPDDLPVKAAQVTGDYTRSSDTLSVGAMIDVKGFEFSQVIIVGCGEDLLPFNGSAREEQWRDALRLYVAMTRARDEVRLLYSRKPSRFLIDMKEGLDWIEC